VSSAWRFVLAIGLVSFLAGAVSDVGDFWGLLPGRLGEGRWAWPLLLGYGLNLLASRPGPFSPSDGGGLR
jgi:hypothetical protein